MKTKLILTLLLFSAITFSANAKTQVTKLKCEYHENPIGIDVENPG